MDVSARAQLVRCSPRKVRLVVDGLRGLVAQDALSQLRYSSSPVARDVAKLVHSALANAENNYRLEPGGMRIKQIVADEGPRMKRFRPGPHGRVKPYRHRTSHVTVYLQEG